MIEIYFCFLVVCFCVLLTVTVSWLSHTLFSPEALSELPLISVGSLVAIVSILLFTRSTCMEELWFLTTRISCVAMWEVYKIYLLNYFCRCCACTIIPYFTNETETRLSYVLVLEFGHLSASESWLCASKCLFRGPGCHNISARHNKWLKLKASEPIQTIINHVPRCTCRAFCRLCSGS